MFAIFLILAADVFAGPWRKPLVDRFGEASEEDVPPKHGTASTQSGSMRLHLDKIEIRFELQFFILSAFVFNWFALEFCGVICIGMERVGIK